MMHVEIPVLAEASSLQPFGTIIVLAIIAGMAAFGFQYGLFLAILAGLGAIATLLVTFGLGEAVASLLVAVEVPADYALPISIGVLAVGGALAVRFAIGGAVGEETLRFATLIDKIGGVLVGGLAGMIVAGGLLAVLSAMPIPGNYRIDGSQTKYDLGSRVLRTFARLVEPDQGKRQILLEGEPPSDSESDDASAVSELFIDTNGNGLFDVEGEAAERHLDHDQDGRFSPQMWFVDGNKNGKRDIGLLERYRLGGWQKVRVIHHPKITSSNKAEPNAVLKDGQEVYKATATDLDPGDTITFSLRDPDIPKPAEAPPPKPPEAGTADNGEAGTESKEAAAASPAPVAQPSSDELPFAIDPASGSVTVKNADAFMRRAEPSRIMVVATDKAGNTDEKIVSIFYRGVKPGE